MQAKHIALAWFLILVTVGVIVLLSIFIAVKRRVARRKSRFDRTTYTPCGYGLSKVWKEAVERRLNATVRIRTEPRVYGAWFEKSVQDCLGEENSILTVCPDLEAPPIRGIHAFLMSARQNAFQPSASRERIEEYSRLYLWARHDLDPFGEAEYSKFCAVHEELMNGIPRGDLAQESDVSQVGGSSFFTRNWPKLTAHSRQQSKSSSQLAKQSSTEPQLFVLARPSAKSDNRRPSGGSSREIVDKSNLSGIPLKHLKHRKVGGVGHHILLTDVEMPAVQLQQPQRPSPSTRLTAEGIVSALPGDEVVGPGGSCGSDGSQTALIDLDPSFVTPPEENDGENDRETFACTPDRSGRGVDNEAVNC